MCVGVRKCEYKLACVSASVREWVSVRCRAVVLDSVISRPIALLAVALVPTLIQILLVDVALLYQVRKEGSCGQHRAVFRSAAVSSLLVGMCERSERGLANSEGTPVRDRDSVRGTE